LRKAKPLLGEGIEIRGFDLSSIATEVGPTEVVSEDEENVRLGVGIRGNARSKAKSKSQNEVEQVVVEWHGFNRRWGSNH
jgi:hypothetical protein